MVGLAVDRGMDVKSSSFHHRAAPPQAGSKRSRECKTPGELICGPGLGVFYLTAPHVPLATESNGYAQLKGSQELGCVTRKKGTWV